MSVFLLDIKTLLLIRLSSTWMKIGLMKKQTCKESSKSCSSTGSCTLLHNEVTLKAAEFKFKYDFYCFKGTVFEFPDCTLYLHL